ncbi:hypothetical protein ACTD5D_10785 [Nocardia takedensis]|nr:hypothetical protein [Nocardia takedensis]
MDTTDQSRSGSQAVHRARRVEHLLIHTALVRRRAIDLMRIPHGICRR